MVAQEQLAVNASHALERGVSALVNKQWSDGRWEEEVRWCPIITAQYVATSYITGNSISQSRRRRLEINLERTQTADGLWALGLPPGVRALSDPPPSLFVTTLAYVAARLLGWAPDDPRLRRAHAFILAEGTAMAIPRWGKFWLALLNLYDWRGVEPLMPELWLLPPRLLPVHPDKFYCHTRLIHTAMAYIYARQWQSPVTPLIHQLRHEIFDTPYEQVDFAKARSTVRTAECHVPTSRFLRGMFKAARIYERLSNRMFHQAAAEKLMQHIRYDLATTNQAAISPVSGLLNIIALWIDGGDSRRLKRALEGLEYWVWESEDEASLSGCRSATWETAFALESLAPAESFSTRASESLSRGRRYLAQQQISRQFRHYRKFFRIDPYGGFCLADLSHGWPVSDCTAEAMSALLVSPAESHKLRMSEAAAFILRCCNPDGAFGTYESRRGRSTLEFLNGAEMFPDSTTEHSFVECTASCLVALARFRRFFPDLWNRDLDTAFTRAGKWLLRQQRADGSFPGFWGVNTIYGTFFGIRGLLACGFEPASPPVHQACEWFAASQRSDGGWGEHYAGCITDTYVPHPNGQVTQTAWALIGLLLADAPYKEHIDRGVRFLMRHQQDDGAWPREEHTGVFFRTSLIEFALYRLLFPVWALGLYVNREQGSR